MASQTQTTNLDAEISIFDVKELYDRAYDAEIDKNLFKALLADAIQMDMAYRKQLQSRAIYKEPATQKSFDETTKETQQDKIFNVAQR